jgi:hypothetical protein
MFSQGELNLMSGRAAPDERRLNALAGNFGRQHMSSVVAPCEGSCGRQKRVVLAPVAGVKLMEIVGPDRVSIDRQSVSDGGKTNSSPGRARHKPLKPLRREGRVFRRTCGLSCAFLRMTAGAEGTRLSLHPPLSRGIAINNLGRRPRREIAMSCPARIMHNGDRMARPARRALPRRGAFRGARGLIICCHLIMGFDQRCAGLLTE